MRNASGADRLSFPFFLDPSWDAVVERLPIVDRPDDDEDAARALGPARASTASPGTYGDYILGKVARCFPTSPGRSFSRLLLVAGLGQEVGGRASAVARPAARSTTAAR